MLRQNRPSTVFVVSNLVLIDERFFCVLKIVNECSLDVFIMDGKTDTDNDNKTSIRISSSSSLLSCLSQRW